MANKYGHNVGAPITTYQEGDTYATHYSNEGQGGYKIVATIAERNAIPAERREVGMPCFVTGEGASGTQYRLIGGIDNTNWVSETVPGTTAPSDWGYYP